MTRCGYVEKRLRAYVDGELPAGEGKQVALHLETCAACSGENPETCNTSSKS